MLLPAAAWLTPIGFLQEPGGPKPTYTAEVKVVNVLATVRDRSGRLLTNLDKEHFILEEDGVRQEIRYFSRQTDLPLRLGLLVDTSFSQVRLIPEERNAARVFLESMIREKRDFAFLISFDSDVELLQDFTDSVSLFAAGIDELNVELFPPKPPSNPTLKRKPAGTLLHDAVFLAAEEIFRGQSGRKAMILVSDGHDQGSRMSFQTALSAVQRESVVVYSILHIDEEFAMRTYRDPKVGPIGLRRLSEQTGGSYFRAGEEITLKEVFSKISDEMRSQYNIGYTPNCEFSRAVFRTINLRCTKSGVTVKARKGYFSDRLGPVAN